MLVLFDVDGTLLDSRDQGRAAMDGALEEVFGLRDGTEGVAFAGRLDRVIFAEIRALHDLDGGDEGEARFRAAYSRRLRDTYERRPERRPRALPGAVALVEALADRADADAGLLTGNYDDTGRLKVTAAGFAAEHFAVGAFGSDADARPDLLPIALERLRAAGGRDLSPADVVIVGDTPHDVDCARAHGARALAVTTGFSSPAELEASGPDRLVADLTDTAGLLAWFLGR